jgi:hypothetical protein
MAKTLIQRYTYEVTVESENKSQFKEPVLQPRLGLIHVPSITFFYSPYPWFDFWPEDSSSISPSSRKMLDISLKQATTASLRVLHTSLPTLIPPPHSKQEAL